MQLGSPPRRRTATQAGFTTTEVLAATTLGLIALTGFTSFNRFQLFALRNQANQIDVQANARSVVDLFSREVRRAGLNLTCNPNIHTIADANQTQVHIQSDLNGDGVLSQPNEDITYRFNSSTNAVERVDAHASTDTLASGVDTANSRLRYFDTTGTEIPVPNGGLTATQRAAVRRVRIELSLTETAVDPLNSTPLRAQVAGDINLRNRFFIATMPCTSP